MRVEEVSFESKDAKIRGKLYVPDETPAPALIVCHGFDKRGFRGYEIFEQMAKAACENGFVSLVFDFRGCGRSTGVFGYGWGEQEDLEAAIDFLASRLEANSNSVYVVGHSLGGAVALYVAEKDKRLKGVVLWATPHDHAYNIKRFITRTRGRLGYYLFLLLSYVDVVVPVSRLFSLRVYGVVLRPRDVRRRLMRLRESEVLARLENVPVLIVDGSDDKIVGLEEAKMNFEAARTKRKELVVIESAKPVAFHGSEEEVTASHVFQGKEEETIDRTLSWLLRQKPV